MYIVTTCYPESLQDQSTKDLIWEVLESGTPYHSFNNAKEGVEQEITDMVGEENESRAEKDKIEVLFAWSKKGNTWTLDITDQLDFIAHIREFKF